MAVRIPKSILEGARLKAGDELEIELQDQTIVIQPSSRKPTLEDLIDGITPENLHPSTNWGKRVGKEEW